MLDAKEKGHTKHKFAEMYSCNRMLTIPYTFKRFNNSGAQYNDTAEGYSATENCKLYGPYFKSSEENKLCKAKVTNIVGIENKKRSTARLI